MPFHESFSEISKEIGIKRCFDGFEILTLEGVRRIDFESHCISRKPKSYVRLYFSTLYLPAKAICDLWGERCDALKVEVGARRKLHAIIPRNLLQKWKGPCQRTPADDHDQRPIPKQTEKTPLYANRKGMSRRKTQGGMPVSVTAVR